MGDPDVPDAETGSRTAGPDSPRAGPLRARLMISPRTERVSLVPAVCTRASASATGGDYTLLSRFYFSYAVRSY